MINFLNISKDAPHKKFVEYYKLAESAKQNLIEAASISSFSTSKNEVSARYVNLKYIKENEWIFFSNYESPKSIDFLEHNKIAVSFLWDSINVQIRMKANIFKSSNEISDNHYRNRSLEKNILAHSSNQSNQISSYDKVLEKYNLLKSDIKKIEKRPTNWGGFSFIPYYFEFWKGHKNRLNIRESFSFENKKWIKKFLEP
ncbi:MAG: pyridoxamine 5'-phosphate oxidase [Gammaproteobacteria bacterium]|nr:pyridoxamine 5'-phosphate oxidase [Gammaproteobacteria bacterium]|tara:strand:- start:516 stop:1115 length:600 start_codon:yes stop_codon:yes gene_type:complete